LAAVVKHRKSLVDGTAEKIRSRKEPLFASPVLSTGKDAKNVSQDRSNNVSAASSASPGELHPKKTSAATLVESTKTETVALVPFDIARLAQRFYPLFNFLLFPRKPPPAAVAHRVLFTDAEEGYDVHLCQHFKFTHYSSVLLIRINPSISNFIAMLW
jgi:hypothetical protein